MNKLRLGFIGAGQMATALAKGLVAKGLAEEGNIVTFDPLSSARERFSTAVPQATLAASNTEVARNADVLILAIKPQQMAPVLGELGPAITPDHLVISIAAGVTISRLATALPPGTRIVRVMPNAPCLIGRGASGYSLGADATDEDGKLVQRLLGAVGRGLQVSEKELDAVTGLSGSGPAYVYTIIEALADGGVRAGLSRQVAAELAALTVAGAAEMVLQTGEHPARLRDAVTSPGGTTIAGLEALESGALRAALIAAVRQAALRSQELSGGEA